VSQLPHTPGKAVQVEPIKPVRESERDASACMRRHQACLVPRVETRVESAWIYRSTRLKLRYDRQLSSFAFNFNLRRYALAQLLDASGAVAATAWSAGAALTLVHNLSCF